MFKHLFQGCFHPQVRRPSLALGGAPESVDSLETGAHLWNPWSVNVGVFGPSQVGKAAFLKQLMYSTSNISTRLSNSLIFHARKHWVIEVSKRLTKVTDKKRLKKFSKESRAINDLKRKLDGRFLETQFEKTSKMITAYNSSIFKLLDGLRADLFFNESEYLQCRSAFSLDPRVPAIDLALNFNHHVHPTCITPVKYKTEQFKYRFYHSYYKDLTKEMEVEEVGRELDAMILIFSAADIIEADKFEHSVSTHRWIIDIALNEYGPTTMIVLSHIDVLDDYCTKHNLSISKKLERATDHLAEIFGEINAAMPKTPHIEAMDLTKGKFFHRILKSINKAVQEDCGGMNLKAYKEQRKRNFLKSMYGIGGRQGSQAMPSDVNTLIRTSLENRL